MSASIRPRRCRGVARLVAQGGPSPVLRLPFGESLLPASLTPEEVVAAQTARQTPAEAVCLPVACFPPLQGCLLEVAKPAPSSRVWLTRATHTPLNLDGAKVIYGHRMILSIVCESAIVVVLRLLELPDGDQPAQAEITSYSGPHNPTLWTYCPIGQVVSLCGTLVQINQVLVPHVVTPGELLVLDFPKGRWTSTPVKRACGFEPSMEELAPPPPVDYSQAGLHQELEFRVSARSQSRSSR